MTIAVYGLDGQYGNAGVLRTGTMETSIEPVPLFHNQNGLMLRHLGNQIVCPGDSGGAVIKGGATSQVLIGVNSLSSGCQGDSQSNSMAQILVNYKSWSKKQAPEVP